MDTAVCDEWSSGCEETPLHVRRTNPLSVALHRRLYFTFHQAETHTNTGTVKHRSNKDTQVIQMLHRVTRAKYIIGYMKPKPLYHFSCHNKTQVPLISFVAGVLHYSLHHVPRKEVPQLATWLCQSPAGQNRWDRQLVPFTDRVHDTVLT